ncbi:MAG: 6-carboxytetrahydropterin synthase [Lachnospiraceae bacterium]|nr:6-carboxytetrahydropterin synthase [Lachnospiraceae bacterium]
MRYSQYKFNFYLNASHAIYIDGKLGASHPHTWEIMIRTIKSQKEFVMFTEVEKTIEDFLGKYQNRYMNDFEPFDAMNPTLENITSYFLEQMELLLEPLGWIVFYIEVSETPTRSYVISRVENNIVSDLQQKNIVTDIIDSAFSEE